MLVKREGWHKGALASTYSTRGIVERMNDRKLYSADIAAYLDISPATWRAYCTEAPGRRRQAPPPDGTDIERGHARPWWRQSTITAWDAQRPGQGKRRG